MSRAEELPFRAPVAEYERLAYALLDALRAGADDALWSFKWSHPRFRGRPVTDVRPADLELADARLVVAQQQAFDAWADLVAFTQAIERDGPVARFETAVEAVVDGDVAALRSIVAADPAIVRARSTRRHHATLLHYVAANGVEGARQRTPASAVDVARLLLDAGAEADALADMYERRCTTMRMLVSSSHPAAAGLQVALAQTLLDHGAALEGPGSAWQSAVATALAFGFPETARALAARGAPVRDVGIAAGLGRADDVARLLPEADAGRRHAALALAAQLGHANVVRMLLDAGEDPDRYNPDGHHSHATPLHQAVWSDHADVVRLLVARGARLDVRDTIYQGTPLGWAVHGERHAIAAYLREQGAPAS